MAASPSLKAHARTAWDDTGPRGNVVVLPTQARRLQPFDVAVEVAFWWLMWVGVALILRCEQHWATWAAFVVAIGADLVVLLASSSLPLWRVLLDGPATPPHQEETGRVASA